MFGFLFKVVLMAGLVVGGYWTVKNKGDQIKNLGNLPQLAQIKNIDTSNLGKNLSGMLDSLVTHPDRNSPVILGIKITNDSLNAIIDVIQKLPPDQITELKNVMCSPASPSAR